MLFVSLLKSLVTVTRSYRVMKCYLCSMPSMLLLGESQNHCSSQLTFTTSDLICTIAVVPECGLSHSNAWEPWNETCGLSHSNAWELWNETCWLDLSHSAQKVCGLGAFLFVLESTALKNCVYISCSSTLTILECAVGSWKILLYRNPENSKCG